MEEIHILIVDDEKRWRKDLIRFLTPLSPGICFHEAADRKTAQDLISENSFHLAIVDLSLEEPTGSVTGVNELGLRVLEDFRVGDQSKQACGLLILTAYPTPEKSRKAFKDLGVYDILEKDKFDLDEFLETVRAALFHTLMRRAKERLDRRVLVTFTFAENRLASIQLRGCSRYQDSQLGESDRLDVKELARKADQINLFLSIPYRETLRSKWHEEADGIGRDLYRALAHSREVVGALAAGRALAERSNNLSLHFNGPNSYLGVPFELLNDDRDHLALVHPLHRQAFKQNETWTRKIDPFHVFLEKLWREGQTLRILLIASNIGQRTQAVDGEITTLHELLKRTLDQLGMKRRIQVCLSKDATFSHVASLLENDDFHLIHYAGHGRYDDQAAERSGLYFRDGDHLRIMQADMLKSYLQDKSTQLVYLSCCLGARTETRVGEGDFLGVMDAIVQADVPSVLGYRWVVGDQDAKDFALDFYDSLFVTLSLEDAVLKARNSIVRAKGHQDETWASPVLVLQNP